MSNYSRRLYSDEKFNISLIDNAIVLKLDVDNNLLISSWHNAGYQENMQNVVNQSLMVITNIIEVFCLLLIFGEYIKNMMTLISVVSAAMTIALREVIVNFFCGIYIKTKKPFKVEDRIQVNDIKGLIKVKFYKKCT